MEKSLKSLIKDFTDKIPENKRKYILAGFLVLLIALILLSELTVKNNNTVNETDTADDYLTEYINSTEQKIKDIIESIDGAGKAKVMITLKNGIENVYAKDINERESEYVLIENDNNEHGLIIKYIQPEIKGVAIVCEGGDKSKVKYSVINTVSSVLDIKSTNISVEKMITTEANHD